MGGRGRFRKGKIGNNELVDLGLVVAHIFKGGGGVVLNVNF